MKPKFIVMNENCFVTSDKDDYMRHDLLMCIPHCIISWISTTIATFNFIEYARLSSKIWK